MQDKTLIIAYGNRDREDDGAGWHILDKLAHRLGLEAPQLAGEQVSMQGTAMMIVLLNGGSMGRAMTFSVPLFSISLCSIRYH